MTTPTRGRFITLEGIDGAGKSTHLKWLVARLGALGMRVVATREPGGTPLGEKLRALVLSEGMDRDTEALLMFAARREHLEQVIRPALARGDWVVSDRFTDASYAYQCGGRGIASDRLKVLEDWVQQGFQPDLTLLFDLPIDAARERVLGGNRALDRFEREQSAFFRAVRAQYLDRAQHDQRRIRVIDTGRPMDEVTATLEGLLTDFVRQHADG
jgi:dTMP kinase